MNGRRLKSVRVLASVFSLVSGAMCASVWAQETATSGERAQVECTVDLTNPGKMKDIVSNALNRGFKLPRREVALFLDGAEDRYATGQELLKAASAQFKIADEVMAAKVEKYKHVNCKHAPLKEVPHPELYFDPEKRADCEVDLMLTGMMHDTMSNALVLGLKIDAGQVRMFLDETLEKLDDMDGPELLTAAAVRFKLEEDVLAAKVLEFKHVNCEHEAVVNGELVRTPQADDGKPISQFAKDVTLHVVLHELGHALIREFDIPVLGNEETVADAFATYYLTTYMPDRAVDVLTARTTSWMIEAAEDGAHSIDWSGEHDHDARRANQVAALAIAADPVKFAPVAAVVGMSEGDIEKACDYGSEIRRSWRRVLAPLWMSEGGESTNVAVEYDDGNAFLIRLCEGALEAEIEAAMTRFDWHSTVKVSFVQGDGKAGWNRSARKVTVHSAYVQRFISQGEKGLKARINGAQVTESNQAP